MKVSVSFGDELVDRVRAFGQRMGMSQSEAFRYLVTSGLSVELWRGAAVDSAAAALAMVEMSKQMSEEVRAASVVSLEGLAKGLEGGRTHAHACSNTRDPRPKMAGTGAKDASRTGRKVEVGRRD